jgi:prevent-host-death family protein
MRVVTPTDMRQRLGEILDAASAGERILIERDHRPLAVLVSVEDAGRLDEDRQAAIERRLAALDRLVAFGKRVRAEHPGPDDGLTTAEWIRRERERRANQIADAAGTRVGAGTEAVGQEP